MLNAPASEDVPDFKSGLTRAWTAALQSVFAQEKASETEARWDDLAQLPG